MAQFEPIEDIDISEYLEDTATSLAGKITPADDYARRVKLVSSFGFPTQDMRQVTELANLPISDAKLAKTVTKTMGFANANQLVESLRRLPSDQQRQVLDNLDGRTRAALGQIGYKAPRTEKGYNLNPIHNAGLAFKDVGRGLSFGLTALGAPGRAVSRVFRSSQALEDRFGEQGAWAHILDFDALGDAWDQTDNGEGFFKKGGLTQASEILDDDTNVLGIARKIAAGETINEIAEEYAPFMSPEYTSYLRTLTELSSDEKFRKAVKVLDRNKVSFGREFADFLMDRNGESFTKWSGIFDAVAQIYTDPLMIAGKANKAASAAKYGIYKFGTETADVTRRLDDIYGDLGKLDGLFKSGRNVAPGEVGYIRNLSRVEASKPQRFLVAWADAINTGKFSAIDEISPRTAALHLPLTDELRRMRNLDPTAVLTPSDIKDFLKQGEGLRLIASGQLGAAFRSVNMVPTLGVSKTLAEGAKVKLGDSIDWMAHLDADIPIVGRAINYTTRPVAQLVKSFTTHVTKEARFNLEGNDNVRYLKNFLLLGMDRKQAYPLIDEFMAASGPGARLKMLESAYHNLFARLGVLDNPETADHVNRFLGRLKTGQKFLLDGGDTLPSAYGDDVVAGVLMKADRGYEVMLPSAKEIRGWAMQSRRLSVMKGLDGAINNRYADAFMNVYWKPAMLLRLGFPLRAAGEEALSFVLRAAGVLNLPQDWAAAGAARAASAGDLVAPLRAARKMLTWGLDPEAATNGSTREVLGHFIDRVGQGPTYQFRKAQALFAGASITGVSGRVGLREGIQDLKALRAGGLEAVKAPKEFGRVSAAMELGSLQRHLDAIPNLTPADRKRYSEIMGENPMVARAYAQALGDLSARGDASALGRDDIESLLTTTLKNREGELLDVVLQREGSTFEQVDQADPVFQHHLLWQAERTVKDPVARAFHGPARLFVDDAHANKVAEDLGDLFSTRFIPEGDQRGRQITKVIREAYSESGQKFRTLFKEAMATRDEVARMDRLVEARRLVNGLPPEEAQALRNLLDYAGRADADAETLFFLATDVKKHRARLGFETAAAIENGDVSVLMATVKERLMWRAQDPRNFPDFLASRRSTQLGDGTAVDLPALKNHTPHYVIVASGDVDLTQLENVPTQLFDVTGPKGAERKVIRQYDTADGDKTVGSFTSTRKDEMQALADELTRQGLDVRVARVDVHDRNTEVLLAERKVQGGAFINGRVTPAMARQASVETGVTQHEALSEAMNLNIRKLEEVYMNPNGGIIHGLLAPAHDGNLSIDHVVQLPSTMLPKAAIGPKRAAPSPDHFAEVLTSKGFDRVGKMIDSIIRKPLLIENYMKGMNEAQVLRGIYIDAKLAGPVDATLARIAAEVEANPEYLAAWHKALETRSFADLHDLGPGVLGTSLGDTNIYIDKARAKTAWDNGYPKSTGAQGGIVGVHRQMGISPEELRRWLEDHGGFDMYVRYLSAHEQAHMSLQHASRHGTVSQQMEFEGTGRVPEDPMEAARQRGAKRGQLQKEVAARRRGYEDTQESLDPDDVAKRILDSRENYWYQMDRQVIDVLKERGWPDSAELARRADDPDEQAMRAMAGFESADDELMSKWDAIIADESIPEPVRMRMNLWDPGGMAGMDVLGFYEDDLRKYTQRIENHLNAVRNRGAFEDAQEALNRSIANFEPEADAYDPFVQDGTHLPKPDLDPPTIGGEPLRVLITGSRTYKNKAAIRAHLAQLPPGSTIVHGGATGADRLAGEVAKELGFKVEVHPADWKGQGKAAGFKRNQAMVDRGADQVLAFWDEISKGTADTIRKAKDRGLDVTIIGMSGGEVVESAARSTAELGSTRVSADWATRRPVPEGDFPEADVTAPERRPPTRRGAVNARQSVDRSFETAAEASAFARSLAVAGHTKPSRTRIPSGGWRVTAGPVDVRKAERVVDAARVPVQGKRWELDEVREFGSKVEADTAAKDLVDRGVQAIGRRNSETGKWEVRNGGPFPESTAKVRERVAAKQARLDEEARAANNTPRQDYGDADIPIEVEAEEMAFRMLGMPFGSNAGRPQPLTIGVEDLRKAWKRVPENLRNKKVPLEQFRDSADVPDVLKTLDEPEIFALRRFDDNLTMAEQQVSETALARAVNETIPFIDDHRLRSQGQLYIRNLAPFQFAEEAFLKRWARTFVHSPEAIRKAQLGMMGLRHSGLVRQDEYGEDVFVYPGTPALINGIGKAIETVTGKPYTIPAVVPMTGQIKYLSPGVDRFGVPTGGPFVGMAIGALRRRFPESSNIAGLEETLQGERGTRRSYLQQLIPTWASNTYRFFNSSPDRDAQLGSAAIAAMSYLEANGHGLPDNATALQQEEFIERVENWTRVTLLARTMFGFAAPASPQLKIPENLQPEFQELLKGMPLEEAVGEFIRRHPDANAYTVFATKSTSGAPIPAADEALAFMDDHSDFLQSYKQGAAWFLPQAGTTDPFNRQAYYQSLAIGLRTRKSPEEWYRDMKFSAAADDYFEMKEAVERTLVTMQSGDPRRQLVEGAWMKTKTEYFRAHPIFAEEIQSPEGRIRRQRTLDQMTEIFANNTAPESAQTEHLKVMVGAFNAWRGVTDQLRGDQRGAAQRARKQSKAVVANFLAAYADANPEVKAFYQRVLEPELDLGLALDPVPTKVGV